MADNQTHTPNASQMPIAGLVNGAELIQWLNSHVNISSSPSGLVRWRRRGMPHYRITPRCIRFNEKEVWDWLCGSRQSSSIAQRVADLGTAMRSGRFATANGSSSRKG